MATSQSRGVERIQQDYVARIRYSNTLPPPPNPPKLLDIPNTGLASGQYTAPAFAGRLAREQPINIEADGELGMPLDLVGMPGIFDGDESSIQAPLQIPTPHPHDRALLRSLNSLGKSRAADSGVSFLRRTEYISSFTNKSRFESSGSRGQGSSPNVRKEARKPVSKANLDSREHILEEIERSFTIASSALQNPSSVRHPSKSSVKLVESFPILPDLNAFSDLGAYIGVKFSTNPVPPSSTYDTRIENGVLRYIDSSEEAQNAHDLAREAHERDPERNLMPDPLQEFQFFIPQTPEDASAFKRKLDVHNPNRDDASEYTATNLDGKPVFRFKRLRAYETATDTGGMERKYDEEVALAVNDGKDGVLPKGAYYYPIGNRFLIRPQRKKNIDNKRYGVGETADENWLDCLDIRMRDPNEREKARRQKYTENPMFSDESLLGPMVEGEEGDEDATVERPPPHELSDENVESDG